MADDLNNGDLLEFAGPDLRLEALDKSVRVSLSSGMDDDDQIVTRAEKFHDFLTADA